MFTEKIPAYTTSENNEVTQLRAAGGSSKPPREGLDSPVYDKWRAEDKARTDAINEACKNKSSHP